MTAAPPTARSLYEIRESTRQQPAATAGHDAGRAVCVQRQVMVMRTANAVGLYGPPGFKSPILRFLSSSFALTTRLGELLLSAFPGTLRAQCAHTTAIGPRFRSAP